MFFHRQNKTLKFCQILPHQQILYEKYMCSVYHLREDCELLFVEQFYTQNSQKGLKLYQDLINKYHILKFTRKL